MNKKKQKSKITDLEIQINTLTETINSTILVTQIYTIVIVFIPEIYLPFMSTYVYNL